MIVPQNYVILTFVLCQCGLFTSQALAGGLTDDNLIDEAANFAARDNINEEFIQPSSDLYNGNDYLNEGRVKVHKVKHVEHHSNKEKLKTVQSQAKDVADQIATTRVLESPSLPAAHRQDKKSSGIVEAASMADIYFLVSADQDNAQIQRDAPVAAAATDDKKTEKAKETDTITFNTIGFIAVVAGCSVAGLVGLVVAGVCWYKLQKNVKAASEAEYPAYGVTGPTKERLGSPGDRKLAQSAQMYHYQHQKQQMIALEKANGEMKHDGSDEDSEEENEEGDYTVYECPGLAPTGEMEVKNPLFSEETPVTPTPGDERPPEHK